MSKEYLTPKEDGLYCVNGSRMLYYQNGVWYKAVYSMGRYTGNISELDRQPKRIKDLHKVKSY